jgi:hypothetical protein
MKTALSLVVCGLVVALASPSVIAQQSEPGSKPEAVSPPAQSPAQPSTSGKPVIAPMARLNAAKTVYLKKLGGNDIPFNVIANAFDGWAKYMVISSPEKADLIVEITAPEQEDSGFAISSSSSSGEVNNKHDQVKTTHTFTVTNIRMVVVDAHTKTPLWAGNEQPRNAARKNKTEDNLVEASQKLFQHFHDRVEPPPVQ